MTPPQELLHSAHAGGKAADVYWFDAGNNTFWAPKETLIAIRCGPGLACAGAAAVKGTAAEERARRACSRRALCGMPPRPPTCPPARPSHAPPWRSFLLFGWAECNRAQDYVKPGSNVSDPFGNKIKYVELGYPGEWQ